MLVGGRLDRFEFHDEAIFDVQIRVVFAKNRAVFVINRERVLLLDFQALFVKATDECVLVDLLKMTVSVVPASCADVSRPRVCFSQRRWQTMPVMRVISA